MAHTYTTNFVHCIFSTKDRKPTIPADRMPNLFAYFGGIAEGKGFFVIAAGGTANHIHLLIALPATIPLAIAMQSLKGSSSHWLGPDFSWQEGYGAFSVSPSQAPAIKKYIGNQEQHHRKRSFETEFTTLLRKCGIEFDERYVLG